VLLSVVCDALRLIPNIMFSGEVGSLLGARSTKKPKTKNDWNNVE
jgi:hypothetical protein